MNYHFNILRATRNNQLDLLNGLELNQVNSISEGFNNNIIWNIAHNVVVQQLLIYRLSGVDVRISEEMISKYKKGSQPDLKVSEEELKSIKDLLIKTVDWLEEDYASGLFKSYKEYTTSYNITIGSTDEAIAFNNTHEGVHFGYAMALRKLV